MRPAGIAQTSIEDRFWQPRQSLVRDIVVPYQWNALNDLVEGAEPSGTIANFRAAAEGKEGGHHGYVFQDSDLAKWLETVGFVLQQKRDETLEKLADEAIDLIGRAQMQNGYIGTYYQLQKPGEQWENVRDDHEMYNAGHFIEAAVAYYEATGKPKVLDILCKFADHIVATFGSREDQLAGYCGHPEIELALVKLYKLTGKTSYLEMSKFFVEERGQDPKYFDVELDARRGKGRKERVDRRPMNYFQSHAPIREQTTADGHAVRAVYLFAGATDIADEYGDESLLAAVKKLWDNVVQSRMYITGGIGSSDYYEAFSFDYDLPNERAYAETCASIGLLNWGHRLLQIEGDSRYADVMERILYNGLLSGISLDGRSYFYVNPLEVWPVISGQRDDIPGAKTRRQPWFGCACCPPNIARFIASLGNYIYSTNEEELYVHLYIGSRTAQQFNGKKIAVHQQTDYPWKGSVSIDVQMESSTEFTLALRLPAWSRETSVRLNGTTIDAVAADGKGYIKIRRVWNEGDRVELVMDMSAELIRSHPELREANGKVAVQRGPVVYCLEEADNGANLRDLQLSSDAAFNGQFDADLLGGIYVIESKDAWRTELAGISSDLYTTRRFEKTKTKVRLIPYYAWANREEGEMAVWIRERDC
ncbi:glycoside hydrolase family 127 protein [Cohnella endophytica]|uniref:Glycoside hydrolase family 127 protein n=1 Tax=Cohnella endophytica TaxID=2419778 RepID=A0A494XV97_9BACL|nr:beta-L-arabinofuranosidase domain-containing protein [Cohnella endophytica]RKP54488.1 glycoside hydrolase family 127 protein [Cohnella endophytica]